jgi:hypothetical protein
LILFAYILFSRSTSSDPASLLENSTKEKEFIVLLIESLPIPNESSIPPIDIDANNSSTPPASNTPSTTPPNANNHLNHINHPSSELTSSTSSVEGEYRSLHSSGVDESNEGRLALIGSQIIEGEPTPSPVAVTTTRQPPVSSVSLTSILEEESGPIMSPLPTARSMPALAIVQNQMLDEGETLPSGDNQMLDDGEMLLQPMVVVASTSFGRG